MFAFLKNHPFAVEAFFESSLVLTFAVEKGQLQNLIPLHLKLDTLNNKYAFIAVAMVQTKGLRPKSFPKFIGRNFFLIGYRVFVRYTNSAGKNLRGLYILKSETDKKSMQFLGNIFTHYNYKTTDISLKEKKLKQEIKSSKSIFKVSIDRSGHDVSLPPDSPFTNWKEARQFAGPLPFTFTYLPNTNEVLIIEGVRKDWIPNPVKVIDYNFSFFDSLNLENPILANAFVINNIQYYWKKGKIEKWNK